MRSSAQRCEVQEGGIYQCLSLETAEEERWGMIPLIPCCCLKGCGTADRGLLGTVWLWRCLSQNLVILLMSQTSALTLQLWMTTMCTMQTPGLVSCFQPLEVFLVGWHLDVILASVPISHNVNCRIYHAWGFFCSGFLYLIIVICYLPLLTS